ncbi:MAG: hypothetical protein Q9M97_00065 [Candidatus Gracilibacteria bacterium]|nr:hypothetical protein [Candidatus Gracilibacteria bacterium]
MSGFDIDRTLGHNEGYQKFYDSLKADLETKKLLGDIKGTPIIIGDIDEQLDNLFRKGIINDKLDWTSDNFNFIIKEIFEGKTYENAISSIDDSMNRTTITSSNYNKKALQIKDIKEFKTEFRTKLTELEKSATRLEIKEKIVKDLDKYLKSIEDNSLKEDFDKQNFGKETKDFDKLKNKLGLNLDEAFARLDSSNEFKGKSKEILEKSKNIFKDLQKTSLFDTFEANLKEYLIDNKQLENIKLKNILNGVLSGEITATELDDFKNVVDHKSNTTYKINIDDIKKEELKINILSEGEISSNSPEYHIDENLRLKQFISAWNIDSKKIEKFETEIKKIKKLNKLIQEGYDLKTFKDENGKAQLSSYEDQIREIEKQKNNIEIDIDTASDKFYSEQIKILDRFKNNNLFKSYLNEQGITKFDFSDIEAFLVNYLIEI